MPEKSENAQGNSAPADSRSMGEKVRDQLRGSAGKKEKAGEGADAAIAEGTVPPVPPAPAAAEPEGRSKPAVTSVDIIPGPGEGGMGSEGRPEEQGPEETARKSGTESVPAPSAAPPAEAESAAAEGSPGPAARREAGGAAPADEELTRRLEDARADEEIRRRLDNVREWEKKQEAEKREKEMQREEIEKEIEQRRKEEHRGKWKRNALAAGVLMVVVLVAAVLSFSVTMNLPSSADSFPFISTYDVRMPQGTPVEFANIPVTVSGTGEKVIVSISGGLGTELKVGDQITFSEPRRVTIRIFGITLLETDYQVVAEFRGYIPQTQQNDFYVAVMTTRPLPGWAVDVILPANVEAYPVNAAIV